ncbi:MAG: tetratricopeptide repeat protein, partial [Candidatus Eremiobacteraeota bacterium]|nr:tetratricopeptide repeat protein [Candidatus Eremiobacteraeota bacterium]
MQRQGLYIGRYRIVEEVGRGGMGIVYLGEDPLLERVVAIKVLPPKKLKQKTALNRFLREARVSARLDHPNIIKVYDVNQEEGIYHIVMEYVSGKNLRDIIEERLDIKEIDINEMKSLFIQIASAMEYAHELKIIHRDLKPENIKVTPGGVAKVMDFGLACLEDRHSLTEAGAVMGTIAYFSPEQARGERVDHRTDIYSLGMIFYEMLTNELPFTATNPSEMIQKHLSVPPVPPTKYNPAITPDLENLILKALEKKPQDRFGSVKEMLEILVPSASPKEEKFEKPEIHVISPAEAKESEPKMEHPQEEVPTASGSEVVVSVEEKPSEPGEWGRYAQVIDRMRRDEEALLKADLDDIELAPAAIICAVCGAENSGDRKYCEECGSLLTPASFASAAEAMIYHRQGLRYMEAGKYKDAKFEFEQALQRDPNLLESRLQLGRVYAELGDIESAIEAFNEVIRLSPGDSKPHIYLGDMYRARGERKKAINAYREAIRREPDNAALRCRVAFLYAQQEDVSRAIEEYQMALAFEPDNLEANRQLGFLLAAAQRNEEAIAAFEKVVEFNPRDEQAFQWLGKLYARLNQFGHAEQALQASLSINPDNPDVYSSLGDIYQKQRKEDQALHAFKKAINLDKGNLQAHLSMSDHYLKHDQPSRALEELEKAESFHPQDPEIHRRMGDLYLRFNQLDRALDHFERTVSLSPESAELHNRLGKIYLEKNIGDKSIQEYQKAVKLSPYNAGFHENLGMAYYAQNDLNNAIKEIRKAATLDSTNIEYQKNLGLLYEQAGSLESAVKAYKRALEVNSRDGMTHALLGRIYAYQKLHNMAILEFQKALEVGGDDAQVYILLARSLSAMGKAEEAILAYKKAIALQKGTSEVYSSHVMANAFVELGNLELESGRPD